MKLCNYILVFVLSGIASVALHAQTKLFPKLVGAAIAEFQNSGRKLPNSNWTHFVDKHKLEDPGFSVNSWDMYQEDINLLKQLNMNSLRFSIDWSSIQPNGPNSWNEEALVHYDHVLDALIANGITPMVTLHHFTHPEWFAELGGFSREANIKYFVEFSQKVFERFHTKVHLWCTINEPGIVGMTGYFLGIHTPGKVMLVQEAGVVIKNLLKAHVAVYTTLKAIIAKNFLETENHEIGIVHNVLLFKSRYWFDPISQLISSVFQGVAHDPVMSALQNDSYTFNPTKAVNLAITAIAGSLLAYNYATAKQDHESVTDWATGHWARMPGIATLVISNVINRYLSVNDRIIGLSRSFDFIGLNYYASPVVTMTGTTCFPDQVMGDMDLPVSDKEGFRAAIRACAAFGKPVYITEFGCADDRDDRRPIMLQESLDVIQDELATGINIPGIYHWTLIDNYEWHNGFKPKFGLADKNRRPRKSALWFADFIAKYSH